MHSWFFLFKSKCVLLCDLHLQGGEGDPSVVPCVLPDVLLLPDPGEDITSGIEVFEHGYPAPDE
jgi:hypothetical protein